MMKNILGYFIPNKFKKMLVNFKILALEYGQLRSINRWDCVDKKNMPIPWYTYPAIEYLNNLDFKEKKVFEFGSGNSSLYWGRRATSVTSIEHDDKWYEKIKARTLPNQSLLLVNNGNEYEQSIIALGDKFDVIIIDGIRRTQCAKLVKDCLNFDSKDGVMVILDNADWYKETCKYLRQELDLIEIDFHGFGPINAYTWTTSIFLSRNFNFGAIEGVQPHFSVAALRNNNE